MNTSVTGVFGALDISCLAARTVAGDARRRIGLRLADWGLPHLAPDAQLVAAELIANSCAITPEGRIRVRFAREEASLLLAVWDAGDELPRALPVRELELDELDLSAENLDRNGGWGLQLVQALSAECGVTRTEPHGKWVWSRFATGAATPAVAPFGLSRAAARRPGERSPR